MAIPILSLTSFSFPNNSTPLFPFPKSSLSLRRLLPPPSAAADSAGKNKTTAGKNKTTAGILPLSIKSKKTIQENSNETINLPLFFPITLSSLLQNSKITPLSISGDINTLITNIQEDSRKIVPGDLFICRVDSRTDGHDYISQAISKGAAAILSTREFHKDENFKCQAMITVDNNSSISNLAASFYNHPSEKLSVIAVTGTNGKTTTTHLIKCLYEAMGYKIGMIGTIAYYIHGNQRLEAPNTTPNAVLMQRLMAKMVADGAQAVVMEASSHGLALGSCDEIDFNVAVFTNFTRDHLDFHGTMDEYRNSKGKLFDRMVDPVKNRKVVNVDDPNAYYFLSKGNPDVPTVTFGMENRDADVRPLEFELSLLGTRISVRTPKGDVEIWSKLIGRYNVYNVLAAVAVGIAVDMPLEAIVRGMEQMEGVPGRFEVINENQGFPVIVDYAHSPDSLSRLLDAARELGSKRVITVFGCGGERDKGKRPLMAKVAAEKSDLVILTSDNPRNEDPMDILDDMLGGVGWTINHYRQVGESDCYPPLPNSHRIFVHENRRVALRAAIAMGKADDIVVVAGKGHETYQIEGDRKVFFDDREECREAIQIVKKLQQDGIDSRQSPWWLLQSY